MTDPVNRFVAGFLGTPLMNFFNGRIIFKNDEPYFEMGQETIQLPHRLNVTLAELQEKKMVLGVRPESISQNKIDGLEITVSMLRLILSNRLVTI